MEVKVVTGRGTITTDISSLERLLKEEEVISIVVNGEIYYRLGEEFYYIPTSKETPSTEVLEILNNKYKRG